MISSLALAVFSAAGILGCADHTGYQSIGLTRRNLVNRQYENNTVSATNPSHVSTDWAYDASYNWGAIRTEYELCQSGSQQSPIPLSLIYGLSQFHRLSFKGWDKEVNGTWSNWNYGPNYTLTHPANDWTTLPSISWDNQTAYLKGWHIHSPADHTLEGVRSRLELHLVHVDYTGHEAAVLAIRIDPGAEPAPFFSQLPEMVSFREPKPVSNVKMNLNPLLVSVNSFNEFWTYKGSLTSPPCMQGIRWFIARAPAFISEKQLQAILSVSTFSARQEQMVWQHQINGAS